MKHYESGYKWLPESEHMMHISHHSFLFSKFNNRGNIKYNFLCTSKASGARIMGNNKVRKLAFKTDTT